MNRRTLLLGTGAALAGSAVLGPNAAFAQQATITGAGATFPRPVYERWAAAARAAINIHRRWRCIAFRRRQCRQAGGR